MARTASPTKTTGDLFLSRMNSAGLTKRGDEEFGHLANRRPSRMYMILSNIGWLTHIKLSTAIRQGRALPMVESS